MKNKIKRIKGTLKQPKCRKPKSKISLKGLFFYLFTKVYFFLLLSYQLKAIESFHKERKQIKIKSS
jgi:hypothetical protein